MPSQTTKTSHIYFPDGCRVSVKRKSDPEYFDVGAINSAVTATLNYTESEVETANAGTLETKISKMVIDGGFTLINLDPEGVARMGGGLFETVVTDGSPVTTGIADQIISAGWAKNVPYDLVFDGLNTRVEVKPSITITPDGEAALVEDTDFIIVTTDGKWQVVFLNETQNAKALTIDFVSVTPVATTTLFAGKSSIVLEAFAMKISHTDDNGKVRALELFSVKSNSGGFQFNFKGANEDGVEEMPLTYTAKLDTSRDNGKQLFSWSQEA